MLNGIFPWFKVANYTIQNIGLLVEKLNSTPEQINKAAAKAVNKTTQQVFKDSIDAMMREVNLDESYIKKHFKIANRASPSNLRARITANARGTLLTRYPYLKTSDGVKVRVNAKGTYRNMKGAFVASNLRGSFSTGIAMRNKIAVQFLLKSLHKGQGATSAKRAKLAKLRRKAEQKPGGLYVPHARSINQLFISVREDVKKDAKVMLSDIFLMEMKAL